MRICMYDRCVSYEIQSAVAAKVEQAEENGAQRPIGSEANSPKSTNERAGLRHPQSRLRSGFDPSLQPSTAREGASSPACLAVRFRETGFEWHLADKLQTEGPRK